MKISLIQMNSTVGALRENCTRMLEFYEQQVAVGADMVIFPELAVCGYPPYDLLDRPDFLEACKKWSDWLVEHSGPAAMVFGSALPNPSATGKGAHNLAIMAAEGEIVGSQAKTLLPTYDVFDERRYFAPAAERRPIEWRGKRWGIAICEDIWTMEISHAGERPYGVNPLAVLKHAGIDCLISISASPFSSGKSNRRLRTIRDTTAPLKAPIFYCNTVGGNDSLIFDGASFVLDEAGELVAAAPAFEEVALECTLDDCVSCRAPWPDEVIEDPVDNLGDVHDAIVLGLRDYIRKCGFKDVVLGLSGGIDSAVTAALAAAALGPAHVHGVALPSRYSSEHSLADAEALAQNLGIDYRTIPIEAAFAASLNMLDESFIDTEPDITEENMQARLRAVMLMALSNKFGWMLLTTGNKSEIAVGYSTLYGDSCGGLGLIGDLWKTEVYRMAEYINRTHPGAPIPESTITKPPSAELRPDQTDQDSLPPYDELDAVLNYYIEHHLGPKEIVRESGLDAEKVARIIRMVDRNEFKRRQLPPCLRVSDKAFGWGRRLPIAQQYEPGNVPSN